MNKDRAPNSLNQMDAEVIVHSDFSALDRDCDTQLHTLDMEETLSEDGQPKDLHGEDLPQQAPLCSPEQSLSKAFQDQEGESQLEVSGTLLRTKKHTHTVSTKLPGVAVGFPMPGESLDSVGSTDSISLPREDEDVHPIPCEAFSSSQSQTLLCGGLSTIISPSSVFENVACVHHL